MHFITNGYKCFSKTNSTDPRQRVPLMEEKTPHEVVCFQMLDFETSKYNCEVSISNSWQITSFSETTLLQRELFLTMFYTINLSPLLVTKWGFMLIIILRNYQKCPLPLNMHLYPFLTLWYQWWVYMTRESFCWQHFNLKPDLEFFVLFTRWGHNLTRNY